MANDNPTGMTTNQKRFVYSTILGLIALLMLLVNYMVRQPRVAVVMDPSTLGAVATVTPGATSEPTEEPSLIDGDYAVSLLREHYIGLFNESHDAAVEDMCGAWTGGVLGKETFFATVELNYNVTVDHDEFASSLDEYCR